MTFQDFLMNSPSGGLMIKVGDGTPIGGLPPWIASDTVNGGLMFKVNAAGYTPPSGMLQTGTALNATLQVVNDNVGTNSALQLSTTQINFGAFTGAATGNILWRANGTLTEYTGWHQSDGEYRFITKNGSPVFFNIAYGINFNNGFGSTGKSAIDANGNWSIGGSITNAARLHVRGDGTNPIVLFQDNSGTSQLYITNAGSVIFANQVQGPLLRASTNLACSSFTNQSYNGTAWLTIDDTWSTQSYATKTIALTAGATNPKMFSYAYTINNSGAQTGTATGLFLNATETALNGMTHNLMDLQVGGVSKFKIVNTGVTTITSNVNLGILNLSNTSCSFVFGGDSSGGYLQPLTASKGMSLYNSSGSSYINVKADSSGILFVSAGLFQLNGTTSSFPAIKRNGAAIDFRLADDSNYTSVNASVFTASYVGNQVALNIFDTDRQIGTGGAGHIGFKASGGFTFSNVNFNVATTSAMVEITSTTKGFLPPRMTTGEINAIATPAAGLQVYNTDLAQPCFYDGAGWRKISHTNM